MVAEGALLTLPAQQRDFPEWRRGRAHYAVWAVDLSADASLSQLLAQVQTALPELWLPAYRRQPHITVAVCGFPAASATWPDDYDAGCHAAQINALSRHAPAPFALELGAVDSFASAPYLQVRDADGGLAALRGCLLRPGLDGADFAYVPHLTLGLYGRVMPLAEAVCKLRAVLPALDVRLTVRRLSLLQYAADEIGGPLTALGAFDLAARRFVPAA